MYIRSFLISAALLSAGIGACGAPASTDARLTLQWPELPQRIRIAESQPVQPRSESPFTIELDIIYVDLRWTEDERPKEAKFQIPAVVYAEDGDQSPMTIRYDGQTPEQAATAGHQFTLPGIPVADDIDLELTVYVKNENAPLMRAEISGLSTTAGEVQSLDIQMAFTNQIDRDGDGFVGTTLGGSDCLDSDVDVYPGAPERCDGLDTACDGADDETDLCSWPDAPGAEPMQLIPGGEAYVGFKESPHAPRTRVYVDSFYMDRYEVTNRAYDQCNDPGCTAPWPTTVGTVTDYTIAPEYDDYPVLNVTWDQAEAYCTWAQKQLPTEIEWEVAARGLAPSIRYVPWTEDQTITLYRNEHPTVTLERNFEVPAAVATFSEGASPFGIYHMMGNAEEWTSTWYVQNRYDGIDTKADFPPPEPATGDDKVIRGGSWLHRFSDGLAFRRHATEPTQASEHLGFRCVVSNDTCTEPPCYEP